MTPIIQARIARILLRRRSTSARDVRQEVEDLTQHILLLLFAQNAELLRRWDPARGASFDNYVGLIAEREAISILRSRKRSPWGEEPTESNEFDALPSTHAPTEQAAISADLLRKAVALAERRLSGRGLEMLHWLVIEGRTVEETVEVSGLTSDAVYTWKSRLVKQLRSILEELSPDSDRLRRSTDQGAPR